MSAEKEKKNETVKKSVRQLSATRKALQAQSSTSFLNPASPVLKTIPKPKKKGLKKRKQTKL